MSANGRIGAPQSEVFRQLTDIAKLPEWNRAITEVVESPGHLGAGTVWKVQMRALGKTWVSRSTVSELDASAGRFSYRSQSDDGNPSYADWEWTVRTEGDASTVSVTVDLHPATFWRKHLLIKVRRPGLAKEMRESIAALASATEA